MTNASALRLSRHARNKLRWIARDAPAVTERGVLDAAATGEARGYDPRGNQKLAIDVGGVGLIVVLAADADLIVTIWRT